jgi:cellulose synthase/poly-beta-1,6-N-acetylglucosamine synthase-like glycosyltransferase
MGEIEEIKGCLYPKPLSGLGRLFLWLILGFCLLSALYFVEFWFFSDYPRHWFLFSLLSFTIFWGVFRSLVNWYNYLFINPRPIESHPVSSTIDVLTTAMPGEPYEMFQKTLTAISKINGLHQAFLLDGGNDLLLVKLCTELKINHINCKDIGGAKAGKINYCLQKFSNSDLVFIVDPDHIPLADLFEKTSHYFSNPNIGFVQIVQPYYNRNESFIAHAAAEQTYGFYGPILMGLDGLGIPTAIGANCLFRRKALNDIGGHAVHLAEDALTSMRIHAQGYQSVYVPYRGTNGLVPEDTGSFFHQQYKWSTGMFYLLTREYPKLFKKLNNTARIHYFLSSTFYFSGIAMTLGLVLPIILLFTGLFAVEFPLWEFLIHIFPYAFCTVLSYVIIQKWYTHKDERRIPWKSMVLEKASWLVFLLGAWSGITGKKVDYNPTPKNKGSVSSLRPVLPHIIVSCLSVSAILWALLTYHRIDDGTLLMIFFAGLNTLLLAPVILVTIFPTLNRGLR